MLNLFVSQSRKFLFISTRRNYLHFQIEISIVYFIRMIRKKNTINGLDEKKVIAIISKQKFPKWCKIHSIIAKMLNDIPAIAFSDSLEYLKDQVLVIPIY